MSRENTGFPSRIKSAIVRPRRLPARGTGLSKYAVGLNYIMIGNKNQVRFHNFARYRKREFPFCLHLLEQVRVSPADGQAVGDVPEPDGVGPGYGAVYGMDGLYVHDSGTVHAPEQLRVEFFLQLP